MKRIFYALALGAATLSLNSCGLLDAVGRSATRAVDAAATIANAGY